MTRPAEAYVHGIDGPVAVIPGRVAAWLERHTDLRTLRIAHRGTDGEVDAALVALAVAAAAWRQRNNISTDQGTDQRKQAELDPPSELTTAQAADLIGITPRGVRKACATGRLPSHLVADRWVVNREDAEHYRASRPA